MKVHLCWFTSQKSFDLNTILDSYLNIFIKYFHQQGEHEENWYVQ